MNDKIIQKLQQVSIFEYLKDDIESLTTFSKMIELRHFKKGMAIITEGEDGEELFILYNGVVEICKNTLAHETYTVVKLSADNHAFFGELALIDNDCRSATVVASTDCDLLVIKKDKFLQLGNENYRVGLMITRKISQILAQRLRRANQDVVTLYEALVGEIEERS